MLCIKLVQKKNANMMSSLHYVYLYLGQISIYNSVKSRKVTEKSQENEKFLKFVLYSVFTFN